jgi:hypothetical protein
MLLLASCVTQKQAHSREMYEKRAKFIEKHGEPTNHFFDAKHDIWK